MRGASLHRYNLVLRIRDHHGRRIEDLPWLTYTRMHLFTTMAGLHSTKSLVRQSSSLNAHFEMME